MRTPKKLALTPVCDDDTHSRRRQQFLYKTLYENVRALQLESIDVSVAGVKRKQPGTQTYVVAQAFVFHEKFWLWMLDYTAGVDLDTLAPQLAGIVDDFVRWNDANVPFRIALKEEFAEHHKKYGGTTRLDVCAVDFDNQIWYEDALQLLSVAILLRDARSVKRIVKAMVFNRYADALYEQLIADFVNDPQEDMQVVLHDAPYSTLVEAYFEDDDAKAVALVKNYLKNWYKHQDGARWYNAHLKIEDDRSFYYGYWAFEAGATCFLLDLDDSTIDHMVHPKDLVAYARKLQADGRWTTTKDAPLEMSATASTRLDRPDAGVCPK
ncbi:PoNe immunity protein domain-containing protein [Variovorax boronicumulans]|uniref:PoNe immunity protein domain-containing protein n=1 Tax=Variovorax boronicumulans TaxID=436515 RepID=UPI0009F43BCE|nr:PoNe immunity protein domain-containing protein [Variovorax boronicumulans]